MSRDALKFNRYQLPYIHWETYKGQMEMRQVLGTKSTILRYRFQGTQESEQSDALLRTYVGKSPPLHIRRTLDQYYYSRLRDTTRRDCDQVVTRARNEHLRQEYLREYNLDFQSWCSENREIVGDLLSGYAPSATAMPEEREADMKKFTSQIKRLDWLERSIDMSTAAVEDYDISRMKKRLQDSPIIIVDQLWLWALDDSESLVAFVGAMLTQ